MGVGLIVAHAGALGVLGGILERGGDAPDRHIGMIAGTSTCHMALSATPRHVPGVWGPHFGMALPRLWLNEGGQSVTGALLDHVVRLHSAGGEPDAAMHARNHRACGRIACGPGPGVRRAAARAARLPWQPFAARRPARGRRDQRLTMDTSFDSLCQLYYRTALAIAFGTRHILEALNGQGYAIHTLHITGGHAKNPLLMELYPDATGCAVVESQAQDAVLLGTGMVAATAAAFLSGPLRRRCGDGKTGTGAPARPGSGGAFRS